MLSGLALPDTHAAPHQLRAVRFANQCPLQKQVNDRHIAPIKVNVDFFPAEPVQQPWADVRPSEKRELAMRNGVASSCGIPTVHCLHEQELQVVLGAEIARHTPGLHTLFPQVHPLAASKGVPFLQIGIHNGLDEELL